MQYDVTHLLFAYRIMLNIWTKKSYENSTKKVTVNLSALCNAIVFHRCMFTHVYHKRSLSIGTKSIVKNGKTMTKHGNTTDEIAEQLTLPEYIVISHDLLLHNSQWIMYTIM